MKLLHAVELMQDLFSASTLLTTLISKFIFDFQIKGDETKKGERQNLHGVSFTYEYSFLVSLKKRRKWPSLREPFQSFFWVGVNVDSY